MADKPILEVTKLSKSFLHQKHKVLVLDEVSLDLEQGDFVSIIGRSGCGKSTFLELLAGITQPDKGDIILHGRVITGRPGHFGYMPQSDLLFPWLNVLDNILIPLRVKGSGIQEARKQVQELLPVFGLENHSTHLPYQLSGGLKQRVALMRTYMYGAKILLLDEPLANLDALTRSSLQDWIKQIVPQLHLTVILVTHDIDEALLLSNRIVLMGNDPGTIIGSFDIPDNLQLDTPGLVRQKQAIHQLLANS